MRAFDEAVVLVQLVLVPSDGVADDGPRQLVGAALSTGDLLRAAVFAVLDAVNRVLWAPLTDRE